MDDLISRQAAIDALKNDMASLDHIIKGMSAYDVRLDAYVSQRNQVNYDIYTINNLPPVQHEQLGTNLAEVGTECISRQAAIDAIRDMQAFEDDNGQPYLYLYDVMAVFTDEEELPSAQPKRGRWERGFDGNHAVCSNCQAWWIPFGEGYKTDYHFCPNCGCRMDGGEQ